MPHAEYCNGPPLLLSTCGPCARANKTQDIVALGHCVLVAQRDQGPTIFLLEQQITGQRGPAGTRCAESAQQEPDRAWQRVEILRGDSINFLAWRNHQHVDFAQLHVVLVALLPRNQLDGLVDTLQALNVDFQTIQKNTVKRMTGYLRKRWIARHAHARRRSLRLPPDSDDQNPIRPQVQRRTDGRDLAHAAITEKFPP